MEIDEEILSLNPDELEIDPKAKILIKKLLGILEQCIKEIKELRVENQKLRDEIARLKGEKGRPRVLPNVKGTDAKEDEEDVEKKTWVKGSKAAQVKIDRTETAAVNRKILPRDAVFKGHRKVIIQDIKLETDNVQFLIERYYSPSQNRMYEGKMPKWVDGEFGPNLKAFVISMYFKGRIPEEKIRTILTEMGIVISEGQISNIITKSKQEVFAKERKDILEAGMASTTYVHTDDTMLRHKGVTNHVMVLCTAFFGVFFINRYKNRSTVREVLGLRFDKLLNKILISDNARQFWMVAYIQALCWVHEIRHYKKLEPWLKCNRDALEKFRIEMRGFWHLLKDYKSHPSKEGKIRILGEFDRIFTTTTGYDDLGERIKCTFAEKDKLLVILSHPEIPLDNNEAERALREIVVKRKVSYGTRSDDGRIAWENMMTILDTCRKNGVSFYSYVRDTLSKEYNMPRLAELIMQHAHPLTTTVILTPPITR